MELSGRTFIIGREKDCDIVFASTSVSRRHSEILVTDDLKYFIRDTNSTNGIQILRNDKNFHVTSKFEFLFHTDEISFGGYKIKAADLIKMIPMEVKAKAAITNPEKCTFCMSIKEKGQKCGVCGK